MKNIFNYLCVFIFYFRYQTTIWKITFSTSSWEDFVCAEISCSCWSHSFDYI